LPKCDHRQATLELRAHVRGDAIPVDEALPVAASVPPPSTVSVTSPHAVSVVPPSTARWATNPIALLVVLLLLFVGATGVLAGRLWTGDGETQSPVVEFVSEPAPAVAPVAESVPAVEPVPEPPSVVVIRELPVPRVQDPDPESKPVKRRSVKRPPAQPTKSSTERARELESDDEAIARRILNRPMPPYTYRAQPTKRSTKRYVWPESDDEAIQRVLNSPMPPNPYRTKRGIR
jgi:hypothetical protein